LVRHFLIPWTGGLGGAFSPLDPFLCPTTEEKKMAYCPKATAVFEQTIAKKASQKIQAIVKLLLLRTGDSINKRILPHP
jgi:hypothetical protein